MQWDKRPRGRVEMSRGQLMQEGVGQAVELRIYPTTRVGKILIAKQDSFDNITAFWKQKLCWLREKGREREKKSTSDSSRNFGAFRTCFLGFSHQDRWSQLDSKLNY